MSIGSEVRRIIGASRGGSQRYYTTAPGDFPFTQPHIGFPFGDSITSKPSSAFSQASVQLVSSARLTFRRLTDP